MSLVPTYVQFDDDRWYKDPVIGEGRQWFICYDDDDPIELVIAAQTHEHAMRKLKQIRDTLLPYACELWIMANPKRQGDRMFGTPSQFHPAFVCWCWLTAPPVHLLLEHQGQYDELPPGDKVYYPSQEKTPEGFRGIEG